VLVEKKTKSVGIEHGWMFLCASAGLGREPALDTFPHRGPGP
jgi:hypothetical protein